MKGGEIMNKFWELFGQSVIVQALVTLAMVITICYMYVSNQEVPESLVLAFGTVLGFYFGSKSQNTIQRMSK